MTVSDPISADPLIDRTVEGYKFIKRLGEGSYGVVYLARHPRIRDRLVAAKYLKVENPDEIKSAEREIEALARLRHPNVVDIYDAHRFDHYQLIVMELVRGGSLRSAQERLQQPLDIGTAVYMVEQLAFALGYVHAQQILHLDLKPANILLDPIADGQEARPLLSDFGIAKIVRPGGFTSMALLGTPIYMSPEHFGFGDSRPDHRSDIYSLGVILYELVVGKPPFFSQDVLEILNHHAYSPVPLVSQSIPGLPPTLDYIVLRALAKPPEERFQSANEMGSALRELRLGPLTQFPSLPGRVSAEALAAIASGHAAEMEAIQAQYPFEEPIAFRLQVMRPDGDRQSVSFTDSSVVVGRDKVADLQLDHASISRRHAQIDCDRSGNLFVTDLQSINGTYLDGVRLAPLERVLWKNTQYLQIQGYLLQIDGLVAGEKTVDPFGFTTEQVVILLDELQRQQNKPRVRTSLSPNIVYLEPGKPNYVQVKVDTENTPLARYELRAKPGPGITEGWYTLPAGQVIQPGESYAFDFIVSAPGTGTTGGRTHEIALEVTADQPGVPRAVQVLKLRVVPFTRFALVLQPNEVSHSRRRHSDLIITNSGNHAETFSIEVASPDILKVEPEVSQIEVEPSGERAVRLKFKPARRIQKGRSRLFYTVTVHTAAGIVDRVNGSYVLQRKGRVPMPLLILWVLFMIVVTNHFMRGISIPEQFEQVRAVVELLFQAIVR